MLYNYAVFLRLCGSDNRVDLLSAWRKYNQSAEVGNIRLRATRVSVLVVGC
jgi:hypothetical protein